MERSRLHRASVPAPALGLEASARNPSRLLVCGLGPRALADLRLAIKRSIQNTSQAARTVNTGAFGLIVCSAAIALSLPAGQAIAADSPVRGLVRALTQAMISTEFTTQVSKIGFKEGERFRRGDVLVEFDCRRQHAELASAKAQHREMQLGFENNKVLRQSQAVGRNELDISEARTQKAAAEVESLSVRLDQCVLKAPFDGRVSELAIHELETPQSGKPYIGIIADGELEIDLIVPAGWLQHVSIGSVIRFSVDESQTAHDIVVKRLGAAIDPLSQTAKIVAAFTAPVTGVMPGMSGTAALPMGQN